MPKQREVRVLLHRRERVCIDDRFLTARHDVAFPLPLSNLQALAARDAYELSPSDASCDGGMYVIAFMYLVPGCKTVA